jgi:hypothetical protein
MGAAEAVGEVLSAAVGELAHFPALFDGGERLPSGLLVKVSCAKAVRLGLAMTAFEIAGLVVRSHRRDFPSEHQFEQAPGMPRPAVARARRNPLVDSNPERL